MLIMTSCANNKKSFKEENTPSAFQPKVLADEWSNSLLGQWEVRGQSEAGKGKGQIKYELALNGQFLIRTSQTKIIEISPQQKRYLKETLKASDKEIAEFQNSVFRDMEIFTIDPRTGETIGYLFDSLRCVAKGTGKRESNKEIMQWEWSVQGAGTSRRITEKVGPDKLVINEKYSLPGGKTMEDNLEMTRKK